MVWSTQIVSPQACSTVDDVPSPHPTSFMPQSPLQHSITACTMGQAIYNSYHQAADSQIDWLKLVQIFIHLTARSTGEWHHSSKTRKPSCRWQTHATRKHAKNCSNSTYLQRCRWQYWSIFIRLAVIASEICEIPRNSLKIQTYRVQGHPRSSILVSIESAYATSY